jgi:hypothetical protein
MFGKFCYVLGLVIAVGVGANFMTKEVSYELTGSATRSCDLTAFSVSNCTAVDDSTCSKSFRNLTVGTNPKPWNYFKETNSQCKTDDNSCYEKAYDITSDCSPVAE